MNSLKLFTFFLITSFVISCSQNPSKTPVLTTEGTLLEARSTPSPIEGSGNGNGTFDLLSDNNPVSDSIYKMNSHMFNQMITEFDNESDDFMKNYREFTSTFGYFQSTFFVPYGVVSSRQQVLRDHILVYLSGTDSHLNVNIEILPSQYLMTPSKERKNSIPAGAHSFESQLQLTNFKNKLLDESGIILERVISISPQSRTHKHLKLSEFRLNTFQPSSNRVASGLNGDLETFRTSAMKTIEMCLDNSVNSHISQCILTPIPFEIYFKINGQGDLLIKMESRHPEYNNLVLISKIPITDKAFLLEK